VGWIKYATEYRSDNFADCLPMDGDLYIANNYRDIFKRLATELELYDKTDEEKIRIIQEVFC